MATKKTSGWLDLLEPIQKEAIKKMSTERVTTRLRKLCYTDEELNTLTRDELLNCWAEAVLTGEDKATISVCGSSYE